MKNVETLKDGDRRSASDRVIKLENGVYMVKPAKVGKYKPVGPFSFCDEDGDEVAYFSYMRPGKDRRTWEPLILTSHPERFKSYLVWKEQQSLEEKTMQHDFPEVMAEAAR